MSTFLIVWFIGSMLVCLHYYCAIVKSSSVVTVSHILTFIVCILFSFGAYALWIFEIMNDRFGAAVLYRKK